MILLLILVALALGAGLFSLMLHRAHRKNEKLRLVNSAVLLVTVPKETPRKQDEAVHTPKDFKELIASMDQLIASLAGLHTESIWAELTGAHESISLEIVAEAGLISFYIVCSKQRASEVEKLVNSFYPNAQIEKVPGHNIFSVGKGEISAAALDFNKRYIFPIKTYRSLDADPLNSITNVFSKMGEGQAAAIQILIRPLSERWRVGPAIAAKHVLEGKTHYIYSSWYLRAFQNIMDSVSSGLSNASAGKGQYSTGGEQNKSWRLTPVQEDLMKAFNEKAAKPGFEVMIRVVCVGQDQATADLHRNNILSAFAQFNAPAWNGFKPVLPQDKNRLVRDYITRHFEHDPQLKLNSEEIASIFHMPNQFTDTPNIRWLLSKTLPPPVNLPSEGVVVGESIYRSEQKMVRLKDDDRRRHIFMLGKTGTGKTTLFENMIDQDIREGRGVCFVDPLGDAIESILQKIPKERAEDVILFDPSDTNRPVGLNLLEWHTPEEKDFLIAEWIEIFYKLYDPNRTGIVGPQFEHWGRNAALTVMSLPEGGSIIDIPRLFTDDAFRDKAVSYVKDPIVKAFWEQQLAKTADFHKSEMFNYFISKFGRFMTNDLMRNIIGQTKSGFNIRQIMDEGKILLVNLAKGKAGEMNSNLLGLILVTKIQTAAFSRADTPEENRKDFFLYVDEFQNFTTDSFATILSEARKYRLSLNVTNQFIAQLPEKIRDAVIGNAGTMICYRIGAADAEFMTKEFPGVSIDDMVNLDRFTAYVKMLIDLKPSKPFSMRGIKSPIPKNEKLGEAIRQLSRLKYGRDKAIVDAEVMGRAKLDKAPTDSAMVSEPLYKV